MFITIRPVPSNKNLSLSEPADAIQFRHNELRVHAAKKRWVLEKVDTDTPWLTIKFTDSRDNVNHLEVFNKTFSKFQCTCGQFISDESNFCLHAAAFDNLCKNRSKFSGRDTSEFRSFFQQIDRSLSLLPDHLNGYRNIRFETYDAYRKRIVATGSNSLTPVKSVTVAANERRNRRNVDNNIVSMFNPSDEGLLATMELFPYQKNIFAKMVAAKRAVCSMVMGAGKTITTIACYSWIRKYDKPNARLLVIAPKSLRLQWANEIKRELNLDSTQIMRPEDLSRDTSVFVTTYQWYARNYELFQQYNFDVLVADEIQYVKNSESKTWKALSKIKSEYFYGLSGTVIENRLDDLYSIMQIVAPGALGPKWRFDSDFQNLNLINRNRIIYSGIKNVEKLHERLENYIFSYNSLNLPNITYHTIDTELSDTEMSLHNEYMERAKTIIARSLNGSPNPSDKMIIQSLLLKARQACNSEELLTKDNTSAPSTKILAFLDLVNQICVRANQKLVVFSEWTEMLSICKRFLPRGIGYVSYTGAQSAEKRASNLARFQNDPDCKIFFSSDAGGVGLDGLQLVSNNIVHLELPWNPSRLDQRTARVWRIRQTKPVNCYYIVSNGQIEKNIQELLATKRNIRNSTLSALV